MADNEIIKALLYCADEGSTCDKCILYDASDEDCECSRVLKRKAADIINRKQAEIDVLKTNCMSMARSMPNMAKAERYEAIKEFAEKLKEYTYDGGSHPTVWDEFAYAVDNLVAEMVGEDR